MDHFYLCQCEDKTMQVADSPQKLGHNETGLESDQFLHFSHQLSPHSNMKVERCANQGVERWHRQAEDRWPKQA